MSGNTPDETTVTVPSQEPAPSRRLLFASGIRARLVWCVLLAVAVGAVAWFFGLDTEHAVGLGAIVLAVCGCATLLGDQAAVDWAPDPVLARDGARRDVSQLGWALHTRGGGVAPEAMRRLRSVTAQTLELHGLDLDAPGDAQEIARVLGQDTVRLLRRGSAESPKAATYEAIVARLARLADAPVGPIDPDVLTAPGSQISASTASTVSSAPSAPPAPTASTPPEEPRP